MVTDSGGIQEEKTFLRVPYLTVRDNTERPVTVTVGTNTLAGRDPARLLSAAVDTLNGGAKARRHPSLWNGTASQQIVPYLNTL